MKKTNAMRILDALGLHYSTHDYSRTKAVSGAEVATELNIEPRRIFKTLVTIGKSRAHYVFVIPVDKELDLRKAAKAVGEKQIEMIKQKDLLPLTGYMHGGCSPIGMKKQLPTIIDSYAKTLEAIIINAGKIGYQIEISPYNLLKAIPYDFADIFLRAYC